MLDENELYEKWRRAGEAERRTLEEELYDAVREHAVCIVWKRLPEDYRDLVHDIAADVIQQLGRFRGGNRQYTNATAPGAAFVCRICT